MQLNVLGCGVMGRQIASLGILMGCEVTVWVHRDPDRKTEELARQLRRDRRLLRRWVRSEGSYRFVTDLDALEPHLTLEAVVEDLQVKRDLIARLPFDTRTVPLVTNTSSYVPSEIHPRMVGVHFLNPISMLRCAELCAEEGQLTEEIERFLRLLEPFQFDVVRTRPYRGYLANTLLFREIAQVLQLIERFGYSTQAIDTVQRCTGRTTSLFDIVDLVGVDVTQRILDNLRDQDPSLPRSSLLETALSHGVYGKKNHTSIRTFLDRQARMAPAHAAAVVG